MAFVLDWQKKLGYRSDPFVAAPSRKASDYLVDRAEERERLNLFIIKQERFGIIHGPEGSGKSLLLSWLQEQLRAHFLKIKVLGFGGKIVEQPKNFFKRLVDETLNLVEKTVTKPHEKLQRQELEDFIVQKLAKRHVVILVDDAQQLDKENKKLLQRLLEECPKLQLLLVLERVLKEHENYGKLSLNLEVQEMKEAELVQLIQRRIALAGGTGTFPFEEKDLKQYIATAKRHPVRLLELAREKAIELSLKVEGPPKPEKKTAPKDAPAPKKETKAAEEKKETKATSKEEPAKAQEAEPPVSTPAPKKKDGWFKIKFVKEEAKPIGQRHEAAMLDEGLAAPKKELTKDLPRDESIDTDLLNEIVQVSGDEVKVEKVRKTSGEHAEVEDVIQSLVDEMDEKK